MNSSQGSYQLPGNKIALVFSDPAGTNSCIALFEMYELVNKHLPLLYSNRSYFPPKYLSIVSNGIPDFKNLDIDCVFTGTSHPQSSNSYEVNCIKQAKRDGIYVISFIDHWVNFALRLESLSEEEMPDEIWVVDETARQLAIKEGLQEKKLFVRENPYHYFLKNYWKPKYAGKEYYDKIGVPKNRFCIIFAPDPLSLRNRDHSAGFTEGDALESILMILKENKNHVFLIIKMHPLQPVEILKKVLNENDTIDHLLIKDADNSELINASDLVIGFYSNFLLEAKALNKKVIRFFPGNPQEDLLKNNKNIEAACRNEEELKTKILNYIYE